MFARTANCLAHAGLAFLLTMPGTTFAQSVSDFRLQPIPSGAPRASGPVDADAPVVRSARPEVQPAPTPVAASPSPSPSPVATRSPATQPPPSTSRVPAARPLPAPSASARPESAPSNRPITLPSETPSASPSASLEPAPLASAEASALPSDQAQTALPEQQGIGSRHWLAGIGLAIAALALAGWWLHGRPARNDEAEDQWPEELSETPPAAEEIVAKATQPATSPPPRATADTAPKPLAVMADYEPTIGLMLDPLRLSATLTSTSLSYRLSVTNNGLSPLSDVIVAGGMISAHASLPVEQQLATDGQMLELLHQIELLGPSETAELTGDLRLPLPQITPIRSGQALLFIPLARFRVEAGSASALATFVIGETPPVAEAALLPFRIDMGPRIWPRVSRRRVDRPVAA